MSKPTQKRLRELFDYDNRTGHLIRLTNKSANARRGDIAGCPDGRGYRQIRVDGHNYCEHRIVWCWVHGEWPKEWIDHKDGNGLNNRIDNLRLTTGSLNLANTVVRANNTSGYKGVSWSKRLKKWRAQIGKDGKTKELGRFKTKEDAAAAYARAAKQYFGEFACTDRRASSWRDKKREREGNHQE